MTSEPFGPSYERQLFYVVFLTNPLIWNYSSTDLPGRTGKSKDQYPGLNMCGICLRTDRSKSALLLWFLTVYCLFRWLFWFFFTIFMLLVTFGFLIHHLFGKVLLTRFMVCLVCLLTSLHVVTSFPYDVVGGVLPLALSVPYCCPFQFAISH